MTVKRKKKQNARNRREALTQGKLKENPNTLPNTYKFAAQTLKIMGERKGSVSSIVLNKYKSYNFKLIYALVMNTIKNIKLVKRLIEETKLLNRVGSVDDPFLLEILVADFLFGKQLKSVEQSSSGAQILALKDVIMKKYESIKKDPELVEQVDETAKYLRINHSKSNLSHVISQLKTVGLSQLEYSKDKIKFKKFINKFKTMSDDQFMLDFHFPEDLIVLRSNAADKVKRIDLVRKGKAIFQDKASFMAVKALDPKLGDHIIDACCAPGCKTSLIAASMRNKGKILGFDVDKKRLVNAIHFLKVQGVTCAKLEVQDFSKIKLSRLAKTAKIEKFDAIILDPSCSGSGIHSRKDYVTTKEHTGRLKKLQAFQVSLLKHALKSKASKAIVYCTCSTSLEENEEVIRMALEESGVKEDWTFEEVLPYWSKRGLSEYEFGEKCLRSDYDNLTNGFFIAKLVSV